jgi:4-hydroxy-4-methyl-2-oxoglutarate aldolase
MPVRLLVALLLVALLVPTAAAPPPAVTDHAELEAATPQTAPQAPAPPGSMTEQQIIAELRRPEHSTGNIADAVEAVSGARGWMSADMKPISDRKIVGRAWTAVLRPVLKHDDRDYPNVQLQILDEAPAGSVIVYVVQGNVEIAAMGNLMATTAQVRGLEGTVIDGAVRDVAEVRQIGHQVFSRRISPATSVGRMVSVSKQMPVMCAEVMVHPGDYIVGDLDGVVVVPQGATEKVIALLKDYDAREAKMVELIKRERSMLKALEVYGRY